MSVALRDTWRGQVDANVVATVRPGRSLVGVCASTGITDYRVAVVGRQREHGNAGRCSVPAGRVTVAHRRRAGVNRVATQFTGKHGDKVVVVQPIRWLERL